MEDTSTIQRLVAMRVIKSHTRHVTLITLDGLRRLCQHIENHSDDGGSAAELVSEVKHLIKVSTGPDPIRHQLGLITGEDRGPAPISGEQRLRSIPSADTYQFPSSLPEVYLLPHQQRGPYALQIISSNTKAELDQFISWSAAPINTERSIK